jgi:hypothetical protein
MRLSSTFAAAFFLATMKNDLCRNGKVEKIGKGRAMRWHLADAD